MADSITERLLSTTERLIRSGRKAETLTVREIATAAGTSVGLVNYHFGSKGALVAKASERIFADFAPRWTRVAEAVNAAAANEPDTIKARSAGLRAGKEELKALLKDVAAAVYLTAGASGFSVRQELLEGDMDTTKFLAPVLRSILPPETDERELRWACFFIVAPLQLLFLRRDWLADWTGTDLTDRVARDAVFDFLVDRILEPFAGKPGKDSLDTR
ncbi:MAG TPA: hypothetical protein DIC34_22045 [Treponema sp.]|nr:MAG: hypothetical protein A2Y36_15750 [Treponema sp. GWA1_62_8]OHE70239.1 MAG: hypothetical protein A2001_21205 [Treponema sp. GWC1_61_84]HCM29182.1 hypothetical protein [Treponema sp.]